jgi:hypothetical protein
MWGAIANLATGGAPTGAEFFGWGGGGKKKKKKGSPADTTPQSPGGLHIGGGKGYRRPGTWEAGLPIASAGYGNLLRMMEDPYSYPEGRKRAAMQDIERAYGGAEQRYRGARSAYGGEVPTAQALSGQQLELERGAGMANEIREFEDFLAQLGDERMRSIFLPFMAQQLESYMGAGQLAESKKARKEAEPTDWDKALGFIGGLLG